MNLRVALLGSFTLSLLLTGCPLTDHYQLLSEEAAGSDDAGAHAGGAKSDRAGEGGMSTAGASAGSDTVPAGGEAGEAAVSGAPNGGSGDVAGGAGASTGGAGASAGGAGASAGGGGASAGGAGAPAGGADVGGGGGALETGGGGASGGSAGAGGATCALACMPMQTCCPSGCSNLAMDALNCGACGNACNAGRMCSASTCKGGWVSMAAPPASLVARSRAAVVAMGKSVFFWGGQDNNGVALDTGAIYDPTKDVWKYVPKDPGGPSARMMASAVWTGSVVIVFGGTDANGNAFRDGAMYDPSQSQWTALPASNAVTRRSAPYAYWDGSRATFWGGLGTGTTVYPLAAADRFDLTNWSVSSSFGDPGALLYPGFAVDATNLYVFGGSLNNVRQDRVYSYKPSTDIWTRLANSGLSPRSGPFTVWDGTRLIAWGGRDDNGLRNDGSYLLGAKWTQLGAPGAPSARMLAFRRSGWGFQTKPGVVAFIGGQISLTASAPLTTTGATYNAVTSAWVPIAPWPSTEAHEYGMGVWTGEEFVLWGGRDNNGVTSTGERWAP